jgi:hypothetical protein
MPRLRDHQSRCRFPTCLNFKTEREFRVANEVAVELIKAMVESWRAQRR